MVVVWIVPILAAVRTDLPVVAAVHPVGALLAFALSLVVARGSLELVRDVNQDARTTRGEWILVAVVVVLVLFVSLSGSPEAGTVCTQRLFPGTPSRPGQSDKPEQLTAFVTICRPTIVDVVPIVYAFPPRLRGRLTLR